MEIDADIRRAWTLPGRFYADPHVYERTRDAVFARSWQLVADTESLRLPGQVHPVTLLEGCLDEPIVLTRDRADTLHCLSNVCTHRGTLVAETPDRATCLTCRYHGRRFDLDGRFRSMPEFERCEGFPTEKDSLPRVPMAVWRTFIFAGLAPRFGFEELSTEMDRRVGFLPIEQARLDPTRSRDYLVKCNWALYVENYLEGFHIPFVHASLAAALDYGQYRTETYRYSSLQLGVSKGGEDVFDLPADSPDKGLDIAAYYYWLFPNTMLNFYPWGVSVNVVRPLGVDRTRVSFLSYVWDESRISTGAGAELDRVEREDEAVVEAVQRGVRSRLYDRGRYSPTREQGVHHFHRLLAEWVGKAGASDG